MNELIKPLDLDVRPDDYINIGTVCSNLDHEIDNHVAEKLKKGKYYAQYPAWNFWAEIWFENEIYYCMIKVYSVHVASIWHVSIKGIMEMASDQFGSD